MSKLNPLHTSLQLALYSCLCLWFGPFAYSTEQGDACNDVSRARALSEQGQYIRSLQTVKECAAEMLYLIWVNEREIGFSMDPIIMTDENSPNRALYEYVLRHEDYFVYTEAYAFFNTSDKRLLEIRNLSPGSPHVAEIAYHLISEHDRGAFEGGPPRRLNILIEMYEGFLLEYPSAEFVATAEKRLQQLRELAGRGR